ncbi:MAG: FAD-binding oxidoreductase [Gammaproteobacteria bacterium]|nr:FAD-binding oxidoreductase [Gammaproteobacteria bacterium]
MDTLARLKEIVGSDCLSNDADQMSHYSHDRTSIGSARPLALIFITSEQQLVRLVQFAREHAIGLVPSGGRTGLSGGAVALEGEIVVSFDRFNRILSFDAFDCSVTVQAGVITQQLQAFAHEQGLIYPVDFASAGSSQIGGNIATNAGGIRVLRYGLTRQQITGLKVVTGTGALLNLNKGLMKNATGYDLRHLFIGSEGTLGFITEATFKLTKPPAGQRALLLAAPDMLRLMAVLKRFSLAVDLLAFEFFCHQALEIVITQTGAQPPFAQASDYYVLLEYEERGEQDEQKAQAAFADCLAEGDIVDGLVSQSEKDRRQFWRYRESISEAIAPFKPWKNDISVRPALIPVFLERLMERVAGTYPQLEVIWFGHIGDGNVHLNILKPSAMSTEEFNKACANVSTPVYELIAELQGSISAEHGVGLVKKPFLGYSRSPEEITLMRQLKTVFDPQGIMNPGKLLPEADS